MKGIEIPVAHDGPALLGLGAFMKSTVTRIAGGRAFVSDCPGDLDSRDALIEFERTARELARGVAAVAHDLHPDFPSTRLATSLGPPACGVQHHHAHVAAVMAEHGERGPVLGLALDGYGLGDGGQSWGGELLLVDADGFCRLGHLKPLDIVGGDRAAREPWRMAASVLHALGRGDEIAERFSSIPHAAALAAILDRAQDRRTTTSCGRLFDAAAGLLGLHPLAEFEGQAPIALESLVRRPLAMENGWRIANGELDLLPLLSQLLDMEPAAGADLFHGSLIASLDAWVTRTVEEKGLGKVVLAGGCFLNRVLTSGLAAALEKKNIKVMHPRALPPGDQGVSLGQAWVLAMGRNG